jgi:ubiquitin-protein ligase E3 C
MVHKETNGKDITSIRSPQQLAYGGPIPNSTRSVPSICRVSTIRVRGSKELMNRADRMGSRDDRYSQNQRSCRATIRRETLAEDGFRQLNHEGPRLRGRIKITFVDQYVHLPSCLVYGEY